MVTFALGAVAIFRASQVNQSTTVSRPEVLSRRGHFDKLFKEVTQFVSKYGMY